VPIGWATAGANARDCTLFVPTLDAVAARGLLPDVDTMHLDRGYDYPFINAACAGKGIKLIVARRRPHRNGRTKLTVPLGL